MSKTIKAFTHGSEQSQQIAAMLREVYRRSMTDPSYRDLALNDATAAIQEVGGSIKGWNIKFVDAGDGVDDVFQLPPAIETAPELSEEELEAVAGGVASGCCNATSEAEVLAQR